MIKIDEHFVMPNDESLSKIAELKASLVSVKNKQFEIFRKIGKLIAYTHMEQQPQDFAIEYYSNSNKIYTIGFSESYKNKISNRVFYIGLVITFIVILQMSIIKFEIGELIGTTMICVLLSLICMCFTRFEILDRIENDKIKKAIRLLNKTNDFYDLIIAEEKIREDIENESLKEALKEALKDEN